MRQSSLPNIDQPVTSSKINTRLKKWLRCKKESENLQFLQWLTITSWPRLLLSRSTNKKEHDNQTKYNSIIINSLSTVWGTKKQKQEREKELSSNSIENNQRQKIIAFFIDSLLTVWRQKTRSIIKGTKNKNKEEQHYYEQVNLLIYLFTTKQHGKHPSHRQEQGQAWSENNLTFNLVVSIRLTIRSSPHPTQ